MITIFFNFILQENMKDFLIIKKKEFIRLQLLEKTVKTSRQTIYNWINKYNIKKKKKHWITFIDWEVIKEILTDKWIWCSLLSIFNNDNEKDKNIWQTQDKQEPKQRQEEKKEPVKEDVKVVNENQIVLLEKYKQDITIERQEKFEWIKRNDDKEKKILKLSKENIFYKTTTFWILIIAIIFFIIYYFVFNV